MADSPASGWYTDPGNDTQVRYWDGKEWTDRIRPTATPGGARPARGRFSTWGIAGIVACALLLVGGLVAVLVQMGGEDSPPGERSAPSVVAPAGWEVYVSRSGAIEYAYDPDWTDTLTPEFEAMMISDVGMPGANVELAGVWVLDGSSFTGETTLIVMAIDEETTNHLSMEFQANSFVQGNVLATEIDDHEILVDESLTTNSGLEAWRIDYTLDISGVPFYCSVVAFEYDVTVGVVSVLSLKDHDEWLSDFLEVANSIVVVKPPVSP